MPVECAIDPSQQHGRVIKLEIAASHCECVGDILMKIQKKLAPFMPMNFIEVYFNNRRLPCPSNTSLSSLVPGAVTLGCLHCTVDIVFADAMGVRNAKVNIEDRIYRGKHKEQINSVKVLNTNESMNNSFEDNAFDRFTVKANFNKFEPVTSPLQASPSPPATEEDQTPSMMAGGIVNMVPDVLDDVSISSPNEFIESPVQNPSMNIQSRKVSAVIHPMRGRSHSLEVGSVDDSVKCNTTSQASDGQFQGEQVLPTVQTSNSSANRSHALMNRKSYSNGDSATTKRTRDGGNKSTQKSTRKPIFLQSSNLTIVSSKQDKGKQANVNVLNKAECGINTNNASLDSTSWVEDRHFQRMIQVNDIPNDPEKWNENHVQIWICWASKHFGFNNQRSEVLQKVDGNTLVHELSTPDVIKMVECPSGVADRFSTHLKLLREKRIIAVPREKSKTEVNSQCYRVVRANSNAAAKSKLGSNGNTTGRMRGYVRGHFAGVPSSNLLLSTIQQPFVSGGSHKGNIGLSSPTCRNSVTESGGNKCLITAVNGNCNGQPQLWQFLLDLLTDWKYYNDIQWNTDDGEFKLINPERVAQAWGERKNKPTMNYEKLSRALRYYYDGDMLAKVQGKKFVYKFVCNLKHLLGYDARDLRNLVEKCAEHHRVELEQSRLQSFYSYPYMAQMNWCRPGASRAPSTKRYQPYVSRVKCKSQSIGPPISRPLPRPRLPGPAKTANSHISSAEHPSEISETHANNVENSLLLSDPSDRWRARNASGGEMWSSPSGVHEENDGSTHDADADDIHDVQRMTNLVVNPNCSVPMTAHNSSISPMKFLNPGIYSDAVMNGSVEGDLTQILGEDYQANGEFALVDDDIELDNLFALEEKSSLTSPNRLIQANPGRHVVGIRGNLASMNNCLPGNPNVMANISFDDGISSHSNGTSVISPEIVPSYVSETIYGTGMEVPSHSRGSVAVLLGNETVDTMNVSNVGSSVCIDNEVDHGIHNGGHYLTVGETVNITDNEGETLLNPYLVGSGHDPELSIVSDSLEGWPC